MKRRITSFFFFIFVLLQITGQNLQFQPVLNYFTSLQYKAGLQNWSLTQSPDGEIYVANNSGLLCYDGQRWTCTPMSGNITVRSVFYDEGKIYVGGFKEFGFFKKNEYGYLEFTSLIPLIDEGKSRDDEIWKIFRRGNLIYFQSFQGWYTYDGKNVTSYSNKVAPLYFFTTEDKIFVQGMNSDFFLLEGHNFKKVFSRKDFDDNTIVAMLTIRKGVYLLCSDFGGLFWFDGKNLRSFNTEIDTSLSSANINRATYLPSDSTIVLGTIQNGIFGLGLDGKLKWHFNTSNRLRNNTVLALMTDIDNNIWAGLDNGIALIHANSSLSVLYPSHWSESVGMIHDLSFFNNSLYLATNQGIYEKRGENSYFLSQTDGQNWHLTPFNDILIGGNNSHTLEIRKDNSVIAIPKTEGSSTSLKKYHLNNQDFYLESTYGVMRVYKEIEGKLVHQFNIGGINTAIRNFEIDHNGYLWAAHLSAGLLRYRLSTDLTQVLGSDFYSSLSPNGPKGIISVMKIGNRVVFSNSEGLFTYDDLKNEIVKLDDLSKLCNYQVVSSTPVDEHHFWLTTQYDYSLVKVNSHGSFDIQMRVSTSYFGEEGSEKANKVVNRGQYSYFLMNNCIGRYDASSEYKKKKPNADLYLTAVYSTDKEMNKQVLSLNSSSISNGNITFELGFPYFELLTTRYVYNLKGADLNLKSISNDATISYQSLSYGSYEFTAQVFDSEDNIISELKYKFTVERPFYLHPLFIISIFLLLSYLIFKLSGYFTNKKMIAKQKELEQEKMVQEIKMMEQAQIIAKQEQMLLRTELSDKGKELANMAMNAVERESTIESLVEMIQKMDSNNSRTALLSIQRKMETNQDKKEFWDIYQKNFDLIHENFFRNLREVYPALTATDLKYCALLRLNFTSKDISQFTNLSIRGVEQGRYRLRKKLGLTEGQDLVEFLIDFKKENL